MFNEDLGRSGKGSEDLNVECKTGLSVATFSTSRSRKQVQCLHDQPADFAQQWNGPLVVIRSESSAQTELLNSGGNKSFQEMVDKRVRAPLVIDLSDDDKEAEDPGCQNQVVDDRLESLIWHYMDPQGNIQGPFSMTALKRWSDADYFHQDFMVWKAGQNQDEAVLLRDELHRMFPS